MHNPDIRETLHRQRALFATGRTKDPSFRVRQLRRLRKAILDHEEQLYAAFWQDLRKPRYEAYMTEIGPVLKEISSCVRRLRCWSRPKLRLTPMEHLPALSFTVPEPYGVALIIAPWNYPFNLLLGPLVGALAAGNCAVLKAGHATPAVATVLDELIASAFDPDLVSLFRGGREVNGALLAERYDYVFFTGSTGLGRVVMESAARHLTPVTLELGGKSPVIVCRDASLETAARRIMWGKLLNAGQTCIAPDYLLVHASVRERLFELMRRAVTRSYGTDPMASPHYGRIVDDAHFERLSALLRCGDVVFGGDTDASERYVAPTLLGNVTLDDSVMEEEIFGPILPAIEFERIDEALEIVNERSKPLALYLFTRSRRTARDVIRRTSSGGACVNDVMMQIANPFLPFGGVGASGLGAYHGRASFDTFTHEKSVFANVTWLDLPLRYAPYTDLAFAMVKRVLR